MSQTERHPLTQFTMNMLPFSDAASTGFPLSQVLRLSLFQISVGMATVMLLGTLNRVMIVELGVPAFVVALMVALPVLIAPFRAILGFRSDTHRSAIGWRRVPYIWFGSLWQFGGLAIMPFSLIVLSGDQVHGPTWAGEVLAALAFLMTGLGIHMTQTAGLALASDRSDEETRPRVVALFYVMFLVGMAISSVIVGLMLKDFSSLRLIQVVQGTALATLLLNLVALWKQERMKPTSKEERATPRPKFRDAWTDFTSGGQAGRLLVVVALGTAGFQMQDVLLEPYGGEVLGLSVSATTLLTHAISHALFRRSRAHWLWIGPLCGGHVDSGYDHACFWICGTGPCPWCLGCRSSHRSWAWCRSRRRSSGHRQHHSFKRTAGRGSQPPRHWLFRCLSR